MTPIKRQTLQILAPPVLFLSMVFLAGSKRLIQHFPGASKEGLFCSAVLGGGAVVVNGGIFQEEKSDRSRWFSTIVSLALCACAAPLLTKKLTGRVNLNLKASVRFTVLEAAIFGGMEFYIKTQLSGGKVPPSLPVAGGKIPPSLPVARKKAPPSLPVGEWWSEQTLIENLKKQGFLPPIPNAGGGDCLFLAIASQVEGSDLSSTECTSERWQKANTLDKANILRAIAMKQEEKWMDAIKKKDCSSLTPIERGFVEELYKDMLEEIDHLSPKQVFVRVKNTPFEARFEYCVKGFEVYKDRTSRTHSYAGTPEAMAIAIVLNRSLKIYGKEERLSKTTLLDENQNLRPFYVLDMEGAKDPITFFQTNGGGHYEELKPRSAP